MFFARWNDIPVKIVYKLSGNDLNATLQGAAQKMGQLLQILDEKEDQLIKMRAAKESENAFKEHELEEMAKKIPGKHFVKFNFKCLWGRNQSPKAFVGLPLVLLIGIPGHSKAAFRICLQLTNEIKKHSAYRNSRIQ